MTLRKAAFSAGRWTTASLMARAGLQMVQTMVLARLLAPADFGLMAVVGSVYAIVALFVDMGLSNALIHFPDPPPRTLSTLYWLNLCAAGIMAILYAALAWPISVFYHQPALLPAMLAMGLALPLGALGQQFRVLAEKDLRFSRLAMIEVSSMVCGLASALAVALAGGGVYALVAGVLVSTGTNSALAWWLLGGHHRPGFCFDLEEVKPYLRYGSYRLGDSLFNSLQSQADVLIGSSIAGPAAMGIYTLPRDLTLRLANTVINPVVTRVGLPVMARVQGNIAALKSVYLQTLRMTSSVNFPAYAVLAVWADEVVAIVLGNQWHAAGAYMRIFASWGMIRSIGNPVGSLLYATGHVRRAFWWNLSLLVLIPPILWIAANQAGTKGLALTMLGMQVLLFYPLFRWLVRPACGAGLGEYAGELSPPLVATAIAVAAGLAGSSLLHGDRWMQAATGGVLFAIAYLVASYVFNRRWLTTSAEALGPLFGYGK
jgi:O-antigen/teichoic acid export membrane protein